MVSPAASEALPASFCSILKACSRIMSSVISMSGRHLTIGQEPDQPSGIGIEFLQAGIAKAHHLGDEAIKAHVALEELAKLFLAAFVVLQLEALHRLAHQAFEPDPVGRVERPLIENCREALDLASVEDAEGLELGFQLINLVRVRRFFERRRFVERLEGKLDVLDLFWKSRI